MSSTQDTATRAPRKHTRFETCDRHDWLAGLPRYRRAEFYVEGGPADDVRGCRGGICRLWPGTDIFEPSICSSELELDWTTHTDYPNNEPKPPGTYVRNVHPCAHYDDDGIVLRADPDSDPCASIDVRIGRGSTVYGPARNWRVIETKPEWLVRLELEQAAGR